MTYYKLLQYSTKLPKGTEMAKSYKTRKKSAFSQKKQNLREMEELEESGLFDLLSNRQKLYSKMDINDDF